MSNHRVRQRLTLLLVAVPLMISLVLCSTLPLATRTSLLRHHYWEVRLGRLELWIGDPIDRFVAPIPFLRAENGHPYAYVRTATPLKELGHYWFMGIKWKKE